MASFAPGLGLAGWGWVELSEPFHLAGLGVLEALALVIWPLLTLAVIFGVPAMVAGLWPREWRARWRGYWGRAGAKSAYIPVWLRRCVLAADRHRCVYCGSRIGLQIDHVLPWRLGGLVVLWNLQTLCGRCNKVKSDYWVFSDGRVNYHPFPGHSNERMAERILAAEQAHRRSAARWVRAALELAA